MLLVLFRVREILSFKALSLKQSIPLQLAPGIVLFSERGQGSPVDSCCPTEVEYKSHRRHMLFKIV